MKVKNILTRAVYIHRHRTSDEEEKVNEIRLDYHIGIVCLSLRCYCSFFSRSIHVYTYVHILIVTYSQSIVSIMKTKKEF